MKYAVSLSALLLAACSSIPPSSPPLERPETDRHAAQAAPAKSQAGAKAPAVAPRPWPQADSDIPVDPKIRFGSFDNGMRFAWAANSEPKERCYLRLHVDVGSLAEEPSELGMAHFLEHMAFNGSEHYPAGTLVEWFQSHGMAFGADTNAHTDFSETVYELDLPRSDEETLRSGLGVLRDFAAGLLLQQEEVDAEKGVIDGEEREWDSPDYRAFVEGLRRTYEGTRYPDRLPIGTVEARQAFTSESIRRFWKKWYRPDTMTLVLVGDLGGLDPEPLFREAFADLAAPTTPAPKQPDLGKPTFGDLVFAVHEPEIPRASIYLQVLRPYEHEPVTIAEEIEDLPLAAAHAMLDLRYAELAKKDGAPFLSAQAEDAEDGLDIFTGGSLEISCAPEKWRDALDAADDELRRAIRYGFQQAELDEVRAARLRRLDENVERERTRSSRAILGEILSACERPTVPTSPTIDRDIFRPALEALTIEQCHAALEKCWEDGQLSLFAIGDVDLGSDPRGELLAALETARSDQLADRDAIEVATFAYASEDGKGEIARREHVDDLDFTEVAFANGVLLNVKRTDFRERQILLTARVSEGKLTVDPAGAGLLAAVDPTVNGGGLGAHSVDDMRRLFAGREVGIGFRTDTSAFAFQGSTTADDLLLELELLCAYVTDPGWRPEGLRQLQKQIPLQYERFETDPSGPLVLEFLPEVFSRDYRLVPVPPRAMVEAVDLDQIRTWLAPELAKGPVEVTIVGDLDVDLTIDAAARTLGKLPARRPADRHEDRRRVTPPKAGLSMDRTVPTEIQKALVFAAVPTDDGIEVARRRGLIFLGEVVDDRLRLVVREKLGASYAPQANAQSSTTFPGIGMISIQAAADPERAAELVEAIRGVLKDLSQSGVTEEEVARLREPVLARLRDGARTNGYWTSGLDEAQSDPKTVDDLRGAEDFYRGLTAETLSGLARKYLAPERASVLVVRPEAPKAGTTEAGAGRSGG